MPDNQEAPLFWEDNCRCWLGQRLTTAFPFIGESCTQVFHNEASLKGQLLFCSSLDAWSLAWPPLVIHLSPAIFSCPCPRCSVSLSGFQETTDLLERLQLGCSGHSDVSSALTAPTSKTGLFVHLHVSKTTLNLWSRDLLFGSASIPGSCASLLLTLIVGSSPLSEERSPQPTAAPVNEGSCVVVEN